MNSQLQRLIYSIQQMRGEEDPLLRPEAVDLLLYAPCPVKLVMKEHIDGIIDRYRKRDVDVSVHVPMGCTSVDPFDPIYRAEDSGRLPAIIASIGFGDFWKKEFVDRFVRSGEFEAVLPSEINPMHIDAGMTDPGGSYTIYGVTPYVFLVDTRRLGGLSVPRSWEELLDPKYGNEVVLCGDGDDMADAVILNLYRDKGVEGLLRLARNVRSIMHSSQMAKIAGSSDPDAAGVFVIPWFFAESTRRADHVQVVWPEEGAARARFISLPKSRKKSGSPNCSPFLRKILHPSKALRFLRQ